ncbi:enoyl-CoA hydratase [Hyphomicrobium sulfonivorans]|uniref:enoyl-CoA hydratase n=1 Tax=Hyphomicrobium sulfonivorans TaxID=121290 RepID=UPI00083923B1|nr:enoyl-CoA hydratase [Hyphomicrobium sulfonivorans]
MADTPCETPSLRLEREGQIGFVIISNPARMNAFTAGMWGQVPEVIAEAEADPDIRVIVLRGGGEKAFSAGADISEFENARSGASAAAYDALNDNAFLALSGCSKPTISMIHGFCMGGGLAVALCTDIRLADEAAQFAIPAAKLGLGYNARWMRPLLAAVPPARAKEMLFTGRRFKVAEAHAMGLVNTVVSADGLAEITRTLAAEIAANAPMTVRTAKRTIDELTRNPQTPDIATLDAMVDACFKSEDYAEGRLAFMEKRKPQFKGR